MSQARAPRRIIYHVLPDPAGWTVKKSKGGKASSRHPRKTQALRVASDLARSHPLAQVVVHDAAGVIASDRLYGYAQFKKKKKVRAVVGKIRQAKLRAKRRAIKLRAKRRKAARLGLARQKRLQAKRRASAKKAARLRG